MAGETATATVTNDYAEVESLPPTTTTTTTIAVSAVSDETLPTTGSEGRTLMAAAAVLTAGALLTAFSRRPRRSI